MPYILNEGSIDINCSMDRSVNILTLAPQGNESPLSFVVTRDAMQAGEDLKSCLARQIKNLSRQVQNFKELARETGLLGTEENGGLAAITIYTSFKQNNQQHYQGQCAAQLPNNELLILTLTSPVPFNELLRTRWKNMLASFVPTQPAQPQS